MKITKETFKNFWRSKYFIALEYLGLNYTSLAEVKRFVRTFGFNEKRQLEFLQDFSTWINDGGSPKDACESIVEGCRGNDNLALEMKAAQSIHRSLANGRNIAEGMEDWFDREVVSIFETGQGAGAETLTKVLNAFIKQKIIEREAKAAFFKPISAPLKYILMVCLFLINVGVLVYPELTDFIPKEKLPLATQIVMSFSDFVISKGAWLFVFAIGLYISIRKALRTNTTTYRIAADAYFPLNIYRNFVGMRMLMTLGLLVETRYNISKAAKVLKDTSSPYVNYHLTHVVKKTQFGDVSIAEALNSGILSTRMIYRLKNAANSPIQETKKRAISIAALRSGDEAVLALASTRKWVSLFFWLLLVALVVLLVLSFIGLGAALYNMR